MKPIGGAQGKGIFLFNKLSQIADWKKDHRWKADNPQAETYVVQRCLETPNPNPNPNPKPNLSPNPNPTPNQVHREPDADRREEVRPAAGRAGHLVHAAAGVRVPLPLPPPLPLPLPLTLPLTPLQVYVYRNGFARFSSFRYNSNVKNIGDSYVHLTNAAVQKTAPGFDKAAGCKWGLRNLKLYLIGKYGAARTDQLFREIEEVATYPLTLIRQPEPSP